MASSVAFMPDECRIHRNLPFHHPPFHLRKLLVREGPTSQIPSSDIVSTNADTTELPASPATAARRRQSQILDRWAARQAREMITTIERQTHEAEIYALSITQPVSARAASFLRETSPSLSDSSFTSALTAQPPPPPPPALVVVTRNEAPTVDLPSNVRASSLIQMWRELEAEAGMNGTPRAGCSNCNGTNTVMSPTSEPESEPFGDWESEATAVTDVSSSVADSERGRVVNIVKMLSTAKVVRVFASDDNEQLGSEQREIAASPRGKGMRVRGRKEIEDLMLRLENERRRELDRLLERKAVSRFPHRGRIQSMLRFMFLRRGLVAQEQPKAAKRSYELDQLHKGVAIGFLRERFNHRSQHEPVAACSTSSQIKFPDAPRDNRSNGTNVLFHKPRFDGSGVSAMESSSNLHVQLSENSGDSGCISTSDHFHRQNVHHVRSRRPSSEMLSLHIQICDTSSDQLNRQNVHRVRSRRPSLDMLSSLHIQLRDSSSEELGYICTDARLTTDISQHQEIASPRDPECTLLEANSPPPRSEDLQSPPSRSEDLLEGNGSIDESWDEKNLWVNNLDWQGPLDSPTPYGWQGEIVTEELEPYTHQDVRNTDDTWISDSSNSWRTWDNSRHTTNHDFLENFSDNVEIRELLERRRVTTSLASGFREKMNQLMISFLQRQGQYDTDGGSVSEQDEDQFGSRQNYELQSSDQVASTSSSLVPLPYQAMCHQENWQDASFRQNSSQQLLEVQVAHDLRSDMAQIHHEIFELRKLVEGCMDWQNKLQSSIKQEVSGAICQSAAIGDGSQWTPIRKGSCCICCEMPVDSLLYRCGHMCTCFKCAHELQWSSGRCPICRAPIVDVVRAYANS